MSRTAPIALVTRLSPPEEESWIERLAARMPDERIAAFATLAPEERASIEIAVVADPDPAQVAALPNLVWIQSLWAGVERLVAELGRDAPPIARLVDPELSRTMAEAALTWTLHLQRDVPAYRRLQADRLWRPLPYRRPSSITVGVLGLGVLGLATVARSRDAGFVVKGWSRTEKSIADVETFHGDDGLTDLLERSDIVVCLLPLTPRTRGLLDDARFDAMREGAALVNLARGPIVATAALLRALDSGRVSHAILDVFDEEPLPAASPLWSHPKVTITPHVAAPTDPDSASEIVAAAVRLHRRTGSLPPTVSRFEGY